MKTNVLYFLIVLPVISAVCAGCDLKDKKTTLEIINADRHYYPVLRGQTLDIVYEMQNTGKNPLFIEDIKISCGCILLDKGTFRVLPAGGKGFLRMQYDSSKNIGYVRHYIAIYGNFEEGDRMELSFDLNVVPYALYTRDYEELYSTHKDSHVKTLVDGDESNRGYYMEDDLW